jgi:hypothetical protein
MVPQYPTSAHIGIVGAGAAGLSAAHYLRQAGFEHVTVLEREERVGGKCCSVPVGSEVHEMGAVMATRDYATTLELMRAVGARSGPIEGFHSYGADGTPVELFPWFRVPGLLCQVLVHYAWATRVHYRRINDPGLAGVHPDLHQPFSQFARQHALPSLERAFAPPFTAFGYGFFDEVPAAYVLKYMDLHMLEACARPARRVEWPDGVEGLWQRIAARHDVRTGAAVRRVQRTDRVVVQTDRDVEEFDALILTCPLDDALGFLDATPVEHRLLSQIRTYDYRVLLCRIDGLPEGSGFLPANFLSPHLGHALLWYHRTPGSPLYTVYALADADMTDADVERTCAADLRSVGGRLGDVLHIRHWKYFPHVTPEVMDGGFYETLEALQGSRNTFYAGEVMSFSTVEQTARYSRDLVDRFFSHTTTAA